MILTLVAVILLVQAGNSTRPAQQQPAQASVEGIVIRAGDREPLANVRVSLARMDGPSLRGISKLFTSGPLQTDVTISGEEIPLINAVATMEPQDANVAPTGPLLPPLSPEESRMREVIVSPSGSVAVVTNATPPVFTGPDGRFSFRNVEPGTYRLIFAANGYTRRDYGQRFSNGAGEPIVLKAGSTRNDIVMQMSPTAAISGRILGSRGQPVAGVLVELSRFSYDADGKRNSHRVAAVQTNDRGEYRMYFLTPGRYLLSAGRPGASSVPLSATAANVLPNRLDDTYAQTFYPGTANRDAATPIELKSSADLEGLDLAVKAAELHRIRGRVTDFSAPVFVSMSPSSPGDQSSIGSFKSAPVNRADGTFEFRDVVSGAYTLRATVRTGPDPNAPTLAANADITIADSDVEGIVLTLVNGRPLPGRLRIDGVERTVTPELAHVKLQLSGSASPVPVSPRADGTFTIPNVYPGDYKISINGLPEGFYVKRARFGDSDVLNLPLRITGSDSNGLDILISSNGGKVEGLATNASRQPVPGAQVVLIPTRNRERTDLFKSTFSGPDGRFVITGIPPGDYRLVSWEALELYAFFAPDLVQQAEEIGRPLHVEESSTFAVEITAIPGEGQ